MSALPVVDCVTADFSCLPYISSLAENVGENEASNTVRDKCRICSTLVHHKQMRRHVGVHILKENIKNLCGFCGVRGFSINLVVASGRGKTATMAARSD